MADGSTRLNLTISRLMRVALEVLAAERGLPPTTLGASLMHQALARTMQRDDVQARVAKEEAYRTRDQWVADRYAETAVANALAASGVAADDRQSE